MEQQAVDFELTKEFRDRFQLSLDERDEQFIRSSLEHVKPADITALLYEFNSEESKYVMDLLHIEIQAEIISDLDRDTRKKFLKVYPPSEIMPVKTLDITHCTESCFFRFPQTKVVDFIFICSHPLTSFTILVKPENKNTDDRHIKDHSVRQNLRDE